jgi:hypothetical protein
MIKFILGVILFPLLFCIGVYGCTMAHVAVLTH